jgi:protein ImuB
MDARGIGMSNNTDTPRVLCIWLPNWSIQRVQAVEPKLAEAPLILSNRDPRRGLLVAASNLAARTAGASPTMRLSEAMAVVDAVVREHDPDEDLDALCWLAEQAMQFSPIVGLEQLDRKQWAGRTLHQPQGLLLDVTGIAGLFGGERGLLDAVSQWLEQQSYFGCMALADTVGAAWAMASFGTRQLLAQESDEAPVQRAVPACRAIIVPSGIAGVANLAQLPLPALRIPPDTLTTLYRLGLRRIGDLESLPRSGLASRLGADLISRWDQALGKQFEPIRSLAATMDWSLEETLEFPTEHRETMFELVRRMCQELCGRLARRGIGALRIVGRLDLIERPSLVMQLGLFRPTHDADHLINLLHNQMEQLLRDAGTILLWRMSMQASLTAPLVWRQGDLFDSGEGVERQEIARLVDTLSSRLGRKRVLRASVRRDAIPEGASIFLPLAGRRPMDGGQASSLRKIGARRTNAQAEPQTCDPLRRPVQLLQTPIQVDVAGIWQTDQQAPVDTAGSSSLPIQLQPCATAPARVHYQGNWHRVVDAIGPERLESGWWRGPSVRRDYYRIETEDGQWWWVYRDLNSTAWFVHGHFD